MARGLERHTVISALWRSRGLSVWLCTTSLWPRDVVRLGASYLVIVCRSMADLEGGLLMPRWLLSAGETRSS